MLFLQIHPRTTPTLFIYSPSRTFTILPGFTFKLTRVLHRFILNPVVPLLPHPPTYCYLKRRSASNSHILYHVVVGCPPGIYDEHYSHSSFAPTNTVCNTQKCLTMLTRSLSQSPSSHSEGYQSTIHRLFHYSSSCPESIFNLCAP